MAWSAYTVPTVAKGCAFGDLRNSRKRKRRSKAPARVYFGRQEERENDNGRTRCALRNSAKRQRSVQRSKRTSAIKNHLARSGEHARPVAPASNDAETQAIRHQEHQEKRVLGVYAVSKHPEPSRRKTAESRNSGRSTRAVSRLIRHFIQRANLGKRPFVFNVNDKRLLARGTVRHGVQKQL